MFKLREQGLSSRQVAQRLAQGYTLVIGGDRHELAPFEVPAPTVNTTHRALKVREMLEHPPEDSRAAVASLIQRALAMAAGEVQKVESRALLGRSVAAELRALLPILKDLEALTRKLPASDASTAAKPDTKPKQGSGFLSQLEEAESATARVGDKRLTGATRPARGGTATTETAGNVRGTETKQGEGARGDVSNNNIDIDIESGTGGEGGNPSQPRGIDDA